MDDPRPIISPDELAHRLGREDVRICDVRWYLVEPHRGRSEYDTAHIPGAVFVDLDRDLSAPGEGGGRHPLPTTAEFCRRLERWGISPDSYVVAYDDAGGSVAARLWWMLRSMGHDRAAVLDGGMGAWVASGGEVTAESDQPLPGRYPAPDEWTGIVDIDWLAGNLDGVRLVDARAPERYRGEVEPVDARAGHIPGAVNLPVQSNLDRRGRFRTPDDIRTAMLPALEGEGPVVFSCGSGVSATHGILAAELAGEEGALLYPGSWSEWSSRDDLEHAVGDDPWGRRPA